jgi:hypothetical protein
MRSDSIWYKLLSTERGKNGGKATSLLSTPAAILTKSGMMIDLPGEVLVTRKHAWARVHAIFFPHYFLCKKGSGTVTMGALLGYGGDPNCTVLLLGDGRKPRTSSAITMIWGKPKLSSAIARTQGKTQSLLLLLGHRWSPEVSSAAAAAAIILDRGWTKVAEREEAAQGEE